MLRRHHADLVEITRRGGRVVEPREGFEPRLHRRAGSSGRSRRSAAAQERDRQHRAERPRVLACRIAGEGSRGTRERIGPRRRQRSRGGRARRGAGSDLRTVHERPRRQRHAVRFGARAVHRAAGARSPRWLDLTPVVRFRGEVHPGDTRRGVAAIRILIVDDHKLFADAISPALQRQGIDVVSIATNGSRGAGGRPTRSARRCPDRYRAARSQRSGRRFGDPAGMAEYRRRSR